MLCKVNKITEYQVTRDVFFESEKTHTVYKVFDDSDILGDDQFSFLEIGNKYDCKIGIFGELDSLGLPFVVLDREKIGTMDTLKIKNKVGDIFYCMYEKDLVENSEIHLNVRRYDLLSVGDIINDRNIN